MTVSSVGAVAAGLERAQPTRNTQINNAVSALVREPVDSVNVSSSSVRQSDLVGLRNASVNVAQTQAIVQVAQGATTQIDDLISRAGAVANTAANPNVTDIQRAELNVTFQNILAGIDSIATSTSFNGQNLLDGTFSPEGAGIQLTGGAQLSFPELTTGTLFVGQDINVINQANAQAAQQAVTNAQSELSAAVADFAALQAALNFAQANVSSALQNRDAAQAAISDINLAVQVAIAESPTEAVVAQANNLPSSALQLLES